jgi:hypothetical protein
MDLLVSTVERKIYYFSERNAFYLDALRQLKGSSKYEELIFQNFPNFGHTESFQLASTKEVSVR